MMIRENDPRPGYYLAREGKGKPWMPVRIWWQMAPRDDEGDPESDDLLLARFGLEKKDAWQIWTYAAGQPITLKEYRRRLTECRDAYENDPDRPEARPGSLIDLSKLPPILPRRT